VETGTGTTRDKKCRQHNLDDESRFEAGSGKLYKINNMLKKVINFLTKFHKDTVPVYIYLFSYRFGPFRKGVKAQRWGPSLYLHPESRNLIIRTSKRAFITGTSELSHSISVEI
jgi:hypothetical protein